MKYLSPNRSQLSLVYINQYQLALDFHWLTVVFLRNQIQSSFKVDIIFTYHSQVYAYLVSLSLSSFYIFYHILKVDMRQSFVPQLQIFDFCKLTCTDSKIQVKQITYCLFSSTNQIFIVIIDLSFIILEFQLVINIIQLRNAQQIILQSFNPICITTSNFIIQHQHVAQFLGLIVAPSYSSSLSSSLISPVM